MNKFLRTVFLTIVFFASLTNSSFSQITPQVLPASWAEKIYLQPDKKIYTNDQTIWFKAIVTNAINHAPTTLSQVLHVDLIGPDEKILDSKLIKLDDGIGSGDFDLLKAYPEGTYLLRAYTQWNRNFGSDFFFTSYLRVYDASGKTKADPFREITLKEDKNHQLSLHAVLDPLAIDSLHNKDLTLILTFDDHKDTLRLEENKKDQYLIDYPLPEKNQFVTLQMQTDHQISASKTIVADEDYLDLQFFPESGELVHGLQSRIGFKALDYSGKGKLVEGDIVNEEGELITLFHSNSLGMGSFVLPNADSTLSYFARLKSQSQEDLAILYSLPKVASLGNVLSVTKKETSIQIKAASNYLLHDSISLLVSCRGETYYHIKEPLKKGTLTVSLPASEFPEGIMDITLTDARQQPLAERLFFNVRPESRLNLSLSSDKNAYLQRDLTRLNIEATNHKGLPVPVNLSVLVLNKQQLGQIQDTRENILSYFLLSSELKGSIENPGSYFHPNQNSYPDLDALMLTQGWRRYHYAKPTDSIRYQPETHLSVSGRVSGLLFSHKRKKAGLTLMTFGKKPAVYVQNTGSLGGFDFSIDDEFGKNLNILIQSTGRSGRKKDYNITMNPTKAPEVVFNQVKSIEKADSVIRFIVEKNISRKNAEESFLLSEGSILLEEVTVKGYKMTPERKKVAERYGNPKLVIDGNDILAKEEKWSFGLYSVLMYNFPQIKIQRSMNGILHPVVREGQDIITLVVIDGIPVQIHDYPLIQNIPPSEVVSFEIIENAKNFSKLFLEARPDASPFEAPAEGDVVAIYTRGGKGLFGAGKSEGIMKTAIPVFSTPREFYAPKYQDLQPKDWKVPDLRSLVYWNPTLTTDSLGKASAAFYNADNTGDMQVIVEAISENGEIGYQEMFYDVTKR